MAKIKETEKGIMKARNYQELCEIIIKEAGARGTLEEFEKQTKQGNSKKKQIKEIERYAKIEKDRNGQGYKILEIYDKPLAKRSKNNAIFTKTIELLLLIEAKQKRDNNENSLSFHFTKTQLFELLGMINENFLYRNREKIKNVLIENKYEKEEDIEEFQQRVWGKLTNILEGAFRSLERRSMMLAQKTIVIVEGNRYREATEEEIKEVLAIEREVLNKLGYKQKPFSNAESYYKRYEEEIKERKGWDRTYKEYKIIWNEKYIDSMITVIEKEIEETEWEIGEIKSNYKNELNGNIVESLNTQIEGKEVVVKRRKKRKIEEESRYGFNKDYRENYIEIQERLTELFIKLGVDLDEYVRKQDKEGKKREES